MLQELPAIENLVHVFIDQIRRLVARGNLCPRANVMALRSLEFSGFIRRFLVF